MNCDPTPHQVKVSFGGLLDSLSSRSHGPMLLLPAVIAISPIGMIPGMSVVTATLIISIAVQMMVFSERPWIPQRLARYEIPRDKLKRGVARFQPCVTWFETLVHHRWEWWTTGLAIAMLALGWTARDGVLVVIGMLITEVAGRLIFRTWPFCLAVGEADAA